MNFWTRTWSFEQIGFHPDIVNGLTTREADTFAKWVCFNAMRIEMPELRSGDIDNFEFTVDWLAHEVAVTELELEFF